MKTLAKLMVIFSIFTLGLSQECEEPEEVWFKVSNDETSEDYGKIIQLDMRYGYATTDGMYIYLIVLKKDTDEQMVIMFPIGYWENDRITKKIPKVPEQHDEKEFDLDEYLKKNKGKGRLIHNIK